MLGLGARPSASCIGWIARSTVLAALAVGTAAVASSCSLGNINPDDCGTDKECSDVFGLGSRCQEGYCTPGRSCTTGHDCRKKLGFGACIDGQCQAPPLNAACTIVHPPDILQKTVTSPVPPVILGGVASLEEDFDVALVRSMQLAVDEINRSGGLNDGREIGIVVCDNGGPGNSLQGEERAVKNEEALDYLSGVLGVPAIVGPLSSTDSLSLISHLLQREYPTVIISPAATSPALTSQEDNGLFWRTCSSDLLQGVVLAENVVAEDVAVTRVAVIYVQDSYGEGLSNVFRETYGFATTEAFPYNPDLSDVETIVQIVEGESPAFDGVVIISVQASEVLAFLNEFAGGSLSTAKYFFTDGAKSDALVDSTLSQTVKDMIFAARGTGPALPEDNSNFELYKVNLQSDYDVDPEVFAFSANTYDATYVAAYGVVYAAAVYGGNYDGNQVVEGMALLSAGDALDVGPTDWATAKTNLTMEPNQIDIVGTSGPLQFDPSTGEAPGPIEVWRVNDGMNGFTNVETIEP